MIKKRTRLFNWLIDSSICLIIFLILLKIFSPVRPATTSLGYLKYYFLLLNALYYFLFETLFGKSIGKFFTKTKIVSENDDPIKVKIILIRTFVRYIPFEPFTIFFDDDNYSLHDKLSKTKLIQIN